MDSENCHPPPCRCSSASRTALLVILVVLMIGMVSYKLVSTALLPDTWVCEGGTPADIQKRSAARGSLTSLVGSLTLGLLATCIDMYADVNLITSATLMSLIYGNVVGYIMDVAIGSDSGLKILKEEGGHSSLRFAIKSMAGPNFQRYIVCTMLDA